ncbi:hypothetical protein MJO28_002024 [Puccinia striiformis f. sp. tritici]|uniref:Uncharacterized protein n=1 Tax=Puccinia striiformis f. sp. tritici TaxID=168172 RepID=A0ACC0EVP3_9BASI|nr:hypothetical protein MJO28_002024 [Puccinia striiformis f. sp. tritici]
MSSLWNLSSALVGLLDSTQIENETDFESMGQSELGRTRLVIQHALSIPQSSLYPILNVLLSSFKTEVTSPLRDANPSGHTAYQSHRSNLERFGFLLIWLVEKRRLTERGIAGHFNPNSTDKPKSTKARNPKSKSRQPSSDTNAPFDWTNQIPDILNAMLKALSFKIDFIRPTTQDRDTFAGCCFKPGVSNFRNESVC